jgi:hypothetical protein
MTQQLAALNAVTVQKQNAIMMQVSRKRRLQHGNLQNAGITEKEIAELINISRFSKQYDVGNWQGNGGSHNNSSVGNGSNDNGNPFKLDDKLNL